MTVIEYQHAFENALREHDTGLLLVSLLRLIVAVEQTLRWQLGQLQAIEPARVH
jgi:hypothetical protein